MDETNGIVQTPQAIGLRYRSPKEFFKWRDLKSWLPIAMICFIFGYGVLRLISRPKQRKEILDTSQNTGARSPGLLIESLLRMNCPRKLNYFYRRPLLAAIIYMVVLVTTGVSIAFAFGHFASTTSVIGLVNDYNFMFGVFVLGTSVYYYLMIPAWLGQAFDSLQAEQVFAVSEIRIDPQTMNLFESRRFYFLPHGLVLVGIALWITTAFLSPEIVWWEAHLVSYIGMMLVWVVSWFAFAGAIVNFGLAIYLIRRILLNNEIIVQALHPDRCGGWSPLGKFSLRVSWFALAYGLLLVIWAVGSIQTYISDDYALFIQVLVYLILVPTLFYLPLHSAHKAMIAFRDNLVRETSDRYLQEHLRAHNKELQEAEALEAGLKRMDVLRNLQKHELAYPVWPFDMRTRLAVVINAVTPAIPTILGVIVDVVI